MIRKVLSCAILLVPVIATGQAPAILGGGYRHPAILSVAPGQVITLFVSGVGKHLTDKPLSSSAPLPATLGGISVTLHQSDAPTTVAAPILGAMLTDTCQSFRKTPCSGGRIAAITVQIPFELAVAKFPNSPSERNEAVLNVQEDGISSTDFLVAAVDSNIHFITGAGPLALDYIYQPYVRGAAVMHSDGSPVAPGLPATAGETLVVYGYGFGRPSNAVETGVAPQTGNPVPLYDRFQFSALLPENSGVSSGTGENLSAYISYVGLTPGAVGVYQMNFKVPPAAGIRPCDGTTTRWNFMVTTGGSTGSSESFAFCVR